VPAKSATLRLSYGGVRFALFAAKFLRHSKGRWAGKPVVLETYQLAFVSDLFRVERESWCNVRLDRDLVPQLEKWIATAKPATGVRVHREALLGLPRKNGKSTLASAIALYLLVADDEPGAEVYSAAAAKEQARIVFGQAKRMVESSPRLLDYCKVYRDVIAVPSTDSFYRVLAADAPLQEGLNPHGVIVDELHAHPDRALVDTLTTAQAAREQPLVVAITTAGVDVAGSIAGEWFTRGAGTNPSVRNGLVAARKDKETRFLFRWYSVPESGRRDPDAWKLANPAPWITRQYLVEESEKPRPRSIFERYHLNLWTRTNENWLRPGAWDKCRSDEEPLPGDEVYVGVDLGVRRDTAAVVCAFPYLDENDRLRIVLRAHVWGVWSDPKKPAPPAHELLEGADATLEISRVEDYIRDLGTRYTVQEVIFDPWGFLRSAQDLANEGYVTVEFPQTNDRMCPASDALLDAIENRKLRHDGDEVLASHIDAAVAKDVGRGWRLTKDPKLVLRPNDAAIASALAVYRAATEYAGSLPTVSAVG